MAPNILVVGGDGMLGQALAAVLRQRGLTVTSTSRRRVDGQLHLDLAHPEDWRLPDGITHAVLLASICARQACEDDPAGTARVNVDNTCLLARRLSEGGAHVLFPSTDKVFDGSLPQRKAGSPVCPADEYGRQKARAEALLLNMGNAAVLRLSKVVGPGYALVRQWRAELEAGRQIHPFSNAAMAPVSLGLVTDALERLMAGAHQGIFQLSANADVSFADFALWLARKIGADPAQIAPATTVQYFAPYSTLDDSELRAATGLVSPPPAAAVDSALMAPGAAFTPDGNPWRRPD